MSSTKERQKRISDHRSNPHVGVQAGKGAPGLPSHSLPSCNIISHPTSQLLYQPPSSHMCVYLPMLTQAEGFFRSSLPDRWETSSNSQIKCVHSSFTLIYSGKMILCFNLRGFFLPWCIYRQLSDPSHLCHLCFAGLNKPFYSCVSSPPQLSISHSDLVDLLCTCSSFN